jgi:hypothetical protein
MRYVNLHFTSETLSILSPLQTKNDNILAIRKCNYPGNIHDIQLYVDSMLFLISSVFIFYSSCNEQVIDIVSN